MRNESLDTSYFIIKQYVSNTNENTTVYILQKNFEVNKAPLRLRA
jgi:hypothetical protein